MGIDKRNSAAIVLSRDEVRAVDAYAIEALGISGVVLMENAGRQVADAVERILAKKGRVAIVAGAGNNGGDGFVAARHLNLRGHCTTTFLVAPPEKVAGDAAVNLNGCSSGSFSTTIVSTES